MLNLLNVPAVRIINSLSAGVDQGDAIRTSIILITTVAIRNATNGSPGGI